jgi:hypothetical protein
VTRLHWTKVPPTESGWYWWRKDVSGEAGMAWVKDGHLVNNGYRMPTPIVGGEWYGPLRAPGGPCRDAEVIAAADKGA